MKKILVAVVLMSMLIVIGCSIQKNNNVVKELNTLQNISLEEMKIIDLYVTVMKAAFEEENGGRSFIAVEMSSLEGLSDKGKQEVLKKLQVISENVYQFEDIKNDITKFEQDENGNLIRSINGTLLSVRLEKVRKNSAIIGATSWFGNLGAVLPQYKATYKNGEWSLKVLSMSIS